MKKLENFTNSLSILAEADFKLAESNDIYRTGIIGQFNLTFELAWKALQEIMRMHSVEGAATGSPREILQLGDEVKKGDVLIEGKVYIYNEDEIDEMIMLIRDSFIPAFIVLKDMLVKKLDVAESDWTSD